MAEDPRDGAVPATDKPDAEPPSAGGQDADSWWSDMPGGAPAPTAPTSAAPVSLARAPSRASGDTGRSRRTRMIAGVGALVVVIAAGVGLVVGRSGDDAGDATTAAANGAPAGGGPGQRGMPRTSGTIESVDGDTLTVSTSSDETVEVTTTSETTVSEISDGSLDDLAVGDNVLVVGDGSDGGDTVTAGQVVDSGDDADLLASAGTPFGRGAGNGDAPGSGPPEGFDRENPPEGFDPDNPSERGPEGGRPGGGGSTSGTIASIDGTTIAVTTADDETVTVATTSDTAVQVVSEPSLDAFAPGDEVTVTGESSGDTLTATSIRRGDEEFGAGFPRSSESTDGSDAAT